MGKKRLLAVVICTLVFLALFASTALAGELTGRNLKDGLGEEKAQNQGVSWCSFSGLNDHPEEPTTAGDFNPDFGPGGKSQAYGQDVRLGLNDPEFNPGVACNPNRTPLPPQPNRTK